MNCHGAVAVPKLCKKAITRREIGRLIVDDISNYAGAWQLC
jgi:hypothetical protein